MEINQLCLTVLRSAVKALLGARTDSLLFFTRRAKPAELCFQPGRMFNFSGLEFFMRRLVLTLSVAVAALPTAALADTQVYGSISVNGVSTGDIGSVVYSPAGGIYGGGSTAGVRTQEKTVQAVAAAPAGSDTLVGSWKTDTGLGVSGSVGLDFGMVRAEAEVSYSKSNISGFNFVSATSGFGGSTTTIGDISADACNYISGINCSVSGNTINFTGDKFGQLGVMGNVWVDLPVGGKLAPYAGGGLGLVRLSGYQNSKSVFSWQLGAGVAYNLSPNMAVTLDFRHREASALEFDFGGGAGFNFDKFKTNTFGLGLRYGF